MKAGRRKAISAASMFCVALVIGIMMQYGDAVAARPAVEEPIGRPAASIDMALPVVHTANALAMGRLPVPRAPPEAVARAAIPQEMTVPTLDMPDLSASLFTGRSGVAAPPTGVTTELPVPAAPAIALCRPTLTATPRPLAMVRLTLTGACQPRARVTIHHQGMMFSALIGADGTLTVDVPALARDALFIAEFKSGPGAAASVVVSDLGKYDRAVLQWQGDEGVQLHALEFGAGYDDPGHVWAAAAGRIANAQAGTGGVLTVLGDPAISDALRAEVYTYPTGQSARDGRIVLNVEAEITRRNCGRDVAAQSLQIRPGQPANAVDLTMTMPGCDAIGEFLVLKNMFSDLTLAAK